MEVSLSLLALMNHDNVWWRAPDPRGLGQLYLLVVGPIPPVLWDMREGLRSTVMHEVLQKLPEVESNVLTDWGFLSRGATSIG